MNNNLKALILAAGFGKRLKPYTNKIPKCLTKIGSEPILGYWLDNLNKLGCESVLVNTHYKSKKVIDFISSLEFKKMKINTTYEKNLLGTAGTLLANLNYFANSEIILMHADNFSFVNLKNLVKAHKYRSKGTLLTMLTFNTNNPSSCGIICKDDYGVMTSFHEKVNDPPGNCANGAIYILSRDFINWLVKNKSNAIDFSKDVLPHLNGLVQTWHTDLSYIDIGTPQSLFEARNLFNEIKNHE